MSAVTYAPKTFPVTAKGTPEVAKKGFFARLLDAVIASRMAQAEREYARYVQTHGRDPIA